MKYYVRTLASSATIGPYSVEEIQARLKTGELSVDALATEDTGESPAQAVVWLRVHQLPGLGGGQPPSSALPPPLPPRSAVNSPLGAASGVHCCPACGHALAPDVGSVCDRCGKELTVGRKEPVVLLEGNPEPMLPRVAVDVGKATAIAGGGCLSVLGLILMVLGVLFLIGFLLLLNLMSHCKA